MHRWLLNSFCAILGNLAVSASAQDIAITLDDLPYVLPSRTSPEDGLAQVQRVVEALAVYEIVATGFAVGSLINAESRPALNAFAAAGHRVGNHSWAHRDYGELSPREFRRATRRAHRKIAAWVTGPRYYRFPYLREGQTEARNRAAKDVLMDLGYQNVPVSIDNDDWRYNAEYVAALANGDRKAASSIAQDYLTHMKARSLFFKNLAHEVMGREVAHILLLHMNQINADHLEDLLTWYADTGWTFVSVEVALQDAVYAAPGRYFGPKGLSHIERIKGGPADLP